MRVAVIDVGSNTARLLVADVGAEVETVREEKAFLGLAADIVRHGEIRRGKLGVTGDVVARYARIARQHDAEALEILVTAPGRQGRGSKELVTRLERAARAPVRVLSANEEGSLAFDGAVLRTSLAGVVAVCDVGGGSTELAIGTRALGATWVRSADIGSLRLTRALLPGDPPSAARIDAAREAAHEALVGLSPPRASAALAVGGSARAAAKLVGRTMGPGTWSSSSASGGGDPSPSSPASSGSTRNGRRPCSPGRSSSASSRACSTFRSASAAAGCAKERPSRWPPARRRVQRPN